MRGGVEQQPQRARRAGASIERAPLSLFFLAARAPGAHTQPHTHSPISSATVPTVPSLKVRLSCRTGAPSRGAQSTMSYCFLVRKRKVSKKERLGQGGGRMKSVIGVREMALVVARARGPHLEDGHGGARCVERRKEKNGAS